MPEDVHGNDGGDPRAGRPVARAVGSGLGGLGQPCVHRRRIQPERLPAAVHEMRSGAAIGDRIGGRHEGQGRHEDFVARLHARQKQSDMQRGGAVHRGHRALDAAQRRKLGFETVDVGAHRRDPARVEAFLHIGPFGAGEARFMQSGFAAVGRGDRGDGGDRLAQIEDF